MKKTLFYIFVIGLTAANVCSQEFTFTTTTANTVASRSTIDMPGLAGNSHAIIVATPTGNTARLNTHPIGAWYYNGKWSIFNTDHATMPAGLSYKIQIFSTPDATHFLHVLSRENINGTATYIDNPALNDNPSAQLRIFQNYAPDYRSPYYLNSSEAVVAYSTATGKWHISNSNGKPLYPGVAYNVVVVSAGIPSSTNSLTKPAESPVSTVTTVTPTPSTLPTPLTSSRPARTDVRSAQLAMSRLNEFPKKGLPAAASIPTENLDLAAITMARLISARGEQALPTLLAALQTAGFTVLDSKGKVLLKPVGMGQGLGFYDFEAVGSLKLADRGVTIALDKLASTIVRETPQLSSERFASFILREVKDHAENSQNANLRFWGRLIIELGKSSSQPHDLTSAAPNEIKLTVLQASLILRRLQGDLYALRKKTTGSYRSTPLLRDMVVKAGWSYASYMPISNETLDGPCNVGGDTALILDAAAIPTTTYNGWAMGEMAKVYPALDKVSQGVAVANIALAWGKLVSALSAIKGEITVQNLRPLVRTKNSVPGDRRLMIARVWNEVSDLELLNCLRPAYNLVTGLDFNLPTSGPLSDVAIEWLFEGDNEIRVIDAATQNLQSFVAFEAPSRDSPVTERNSNPSRQVTDEKGLSKMWLVGLPKVPAVVYQKKPMEVAKEAKVLVRVTLKSAKDFTQNWIDIGATAIGLATGGPIGLLGAAAEIGYRLPFDAARATIPVIDHEPCDGQWVGTVTYTVIRGGEATTTTHPPNPGTGYLGGTTTLDQSVTLSGTATVASKTGLNSVTNAKADEITTQTSNHKSRVYCNKDVGTKTVSSGGTLTHTASGSTKTPINVQINTQNDYYMIIFKPPNIKTTLNSNRTGYVDGCPGQKGGEPTNTTSQTEYGVDIVSARAAYGEDPNVLSGSKTIERAGETVTITWNLQRCGG